MPMSDVSQNNKHVINYLDYYLSLKNPEYAVLITGDWGIGKTFLIKHYIKQREEKKKVEKEKKIIHVSLNGLRSGFEVDEAITKELYPVLKNKWIKTIASVGEASIKRVAKAQGLELNSLSMKTLSNLRQSNITYIFDDLERCSMPLEDILGYINMFVEYDQCNVVIIANEKEIRKKHGEENNDSETTDKCIYDRIKEKVIGKTLVLMPETEKALDSFFQHLSDSSQSLKNHKSCIIEFYKISEINNLRILKQSICDFERVYSILEDKHKKQDDFMRDFVGVFFVLSFEIRYGRFSCRDIESWALADSLRLLDEQTSQDGKEKIDPLRKYGDITSNIYYGTVLSQKVLSHILENGVVDKDEILEEVNKLLCFSREFAPSWLKLYYWRDSTWAEAAQNFEIFEAEFQQRKFIDLGAILHAFNMRMYFSRKKIIKKPLEEIELECKAYVDDVVKQIFNTAWHELSLPLEYAHNKYFYERSSKEWENVILYLKAELKKASQDCFIQEIRKKIFTNNQTFKSCMEEMESFKYKDIPILEYFTIDDFCDFLLRGTTREGLSSLHVLSGRHRNNPALGAEEKLIWKELQSCLEQRMMVSSAWQCLSIHEYIKVMEPFNK